MSFISIERKIELSWTILKWPIKLCAFLIYAEDDLCYKRSIGNNVFIIIDRPKIAYIWPHQTPPRWKPHNGTGVIECCWINFFFIITMMTWYAIPLYMRSDLFDFREFSIAVVCCFISYWGGWSNFSCCFRGMSTLTFG